MSKKIHLWFSALWNDEIFSWYIVVPEEEQCYILNNIIEFDDKSRLSSKEGKDKLRNTYESADALFQCH